MMNQLRTMNGTDSKPALRNRRRKGRQKSRQTEQQAVMMADCCLSNANTAAKFRRLSIGRTPRGFLT